MKKPELLAPVGSIESLTAAIEAGCDAVYLSGKKYGARVYANNFNDEELIEAIKYARENNIPFLGICLGMQLSVIEFARNVAKIYDADSAEFNPNCKNPVIHIMENQKGVSKKGGTMRLGAYPCKIEPNTLAHKIYKSDLITERHRHRFEFNNEYKEILEKNGLHCSGTSPD